MQDLNSIYNDYKSLPKLNYLGEFAKEDTLKNEKLYLKEPNLDNLFKLILLDDSLSNYAAERLLSKLSLISLKDKNNSKLDLLTEPKIIAFEDLKENDIYLHSFSSLVLFVNFNQSADFNFDNGEVEEIFDFKSQDLDKSANVFLLGRLI